jgi:16S rRNA (guanine527-N7)-methyltransferase
MIPAFREITLDIASVLEKYDPAGKLESYFDALLEENSRVNLVSRETSRDDLRRLTAESLLPFDLIDSGPVSHYLDIGTGGGFPAFPILLTQPIGEAVLVERTTKKAAALDRITSSLSELSGSNIRIENRTFEEFKSPSSFDLITLRLVRLTPPLLKKILPCLADRGSFIYYASPEGLNLPGSIRAETVRYRSGESDVAKSFTLMTRK